MQIYNCYAPEGCKPNIVDFQPKYNTKNHRRIMDNMFYLISLIAVKSVESDHNPVHLKSTWLQRKIRDYHLYISFLQKTNFIIKSSSYLAGSYSMSYGLHPRWKSKPLILLHKIENQTIIKRIMPPAETFQSYPYLTAFFNEKLSVDMDQANKILVELQDLKMPKQFYLDSLQKLVSSSDHKFSLGVSGRLYTGLTHIKKELRSAITYDGKSLIEIDIVSSHPMILSALFNDNLNGEILNILDAYKLDIKDIIDVRHFDDILLYSSLVSTGTFYDFIVDKLNETRKKKYNRKQAKLRWNAIVNQIPRSVDSKEKAFLRMTFPTLIQFIDNLYHKRPPHIKGQPLPIILQKIESTFVLDKVSKRITMEFPHLPVLTVHDSWLVSKYNVDSVVQIIQDEALQFFGHNIPLKY